VLPEQTSPDQLYYNFSQAALSGGKDIKDFTSLLRDAKFQHVFDLTRDSKAKSIEGIECWKVTEHEDWLNARDDEVNGSPALDSFNHTNVVTATEGNVDNVRVALQKLKEAHPDVETSIGEEPLLMKV